MDSLIKLVTTMDGKTSTRINYKESHLKKSNQLRVCITDDMKNEIETLSYKLGLDTSEFVRRILQIEIDRRFYEKSNTESVPV
jgi:hypothetical protein